MWPLEIGQSTWAGDNFPPGVVAVLTFETPLVSADKAPVFQVLSADGGTLAVGADSYASGGVSIAGTVFIFSRTNGVWASTEVARLQASTPLPSAGFGRCLAISSSGDTLLIGSPTDSSSGSTGSFHGSAYFFTRSGGVWTQQQKILPPTIIASGVFGLQVALSYDGLTAAVAWRGATVGGVSCGVVRVYVFSAGTWSLEQSVEPPVIDQLSGLGFGTAVALSGDGNTLAVSVASFFTSNPRFLGLVLTYTRSGGVWTQQARITDPDIPDTHPAAESWGFGDRLALSEDGASLAVGTHLYGYSGGQASGAVGLYDLAGASWTRTSKFIGSFPTYLGSMVRMDRTGRLVLATAQDPTTYYPAAEGKGTLYGRSGDFWVVLQELSAFAGGNLLSSTNAADISSDGTCISMANWYVEDTRALIEYSIDYTDFLAAAGGRITGLTVQTSLIPGSASPMPATVNGVTLTAASSLIAGAAAGGSAGTTVLLMHFNGTNGAASYIDSSASPLTITEATGFGENLLSTSSPKLGSACLSSNTPNGDMLYTTQGTTSKLNLGTGPFNIQCFVKLTSGHGSVFFYQSALFTNFFNIIITNTNRLAMQCPGGNTTFSTTTLFTPGIWQHLEVSRDASGVIRGFIEGTLLGTTRTYTGDLSASSADDWLFGGSDGSTTTDWDELRVVVGDAVHTASFTPPTTELT